jgi:hypothetical protein
VVLLWYDTKHRDEDSSCGDKEGTEERGGGKVFAEKDAA